MCKNLYPLLVFVIGMIVHFPGCSFNSIKGNGNIVTLEKPVASFNQISFACAAEMRFHISDTSRVVVTVDENLDEFIEVSTEKNVLDIRMKQDNNYSFTQCVLEIYAPLLTRVSISGAGSFVSEDTIRSSIFASEISGAGKIEGVFECDHFIADITGTGKISITGTSNEANIAIAGAGHFMGDEFNLNFATVNINGSGIANINVEKNLNVNISGSGSVNYQGDPIANINKSSWGRVKKID